MFSSKPSKVDYRVLGNEEKDEVLVSHRPKSAIYSHSCTIILSFGWAVTLYLYWQLNIATRRSFTPIPSEVFRPVTKVFQHDNYWSGLSRETQYHWGAQFAGNGALWVEDPDQYGLPQGIVAEFDHPRKTEMADARFYIVSKIHEVHCLSWIRWHWWSAVTGANMSEIDDADLFAVHVDHCFEYLRQALSCGGGEIVLEGYSPLTSGKTVSTSVSGWGREHRCIDFDALTQYQIQQEAKYNLTWSSIKA